MKFILASTISLLLSSVALAHGDKTTMALASVEQVIKMFKAEHAVLVPNFQGIKAWPENEEFKVRIYLPDSVFMNYTCMHHASGTDEILKCHMQM